MDENHLLVRLATFIKPSLKDLQGNAYQATLLNALILLYSLPAILLAAVWLVWRTDLTVLAAHGWLFLIALGLGLLFALNTFTLEYEIAPGSLATVGGTLSSILNWSLLFLFGPTAIWLIVGASLLDNGYDYRRNTVPLNRWGILCVAALNLGVPVLLTLVGLQVYELLGGIYPLQLNRPADLLPPLAALVVGAFSSFLAGVPMFWLVPAVFGAGATSGRPSVGFARQFLSTIGLTRIASPFAILAAVIYTRLGAGWYLFLILGAVGATVLARFLSDSSARARQQAREMAGLEGLSRAILAAPPDISQLPALLAERLPGMLPNLGYLIWLTSGEVLAVAPPELSERYLEAIKTALADPAGSPHHRHIQLPADPSFPENGQPALIVPIQAEEGESLGAVCLTFFDDALAPARYEPVAHSLAAEVAAAWARVTAHSQALANERMSQELAIAGRIQGSFLPATVPALPGWDIAAALVPARQTSGDFYDFIPLPGDRLGLLVADVADKGTGAALYMALSRTLIRTYALAQPEAPAQALAQANERILQDTVSDQFVTVFYGVLDRASGQFTYCNAGHNPAFWWQNGASPVPLGNTGIPLGMFPGMAWEARTVQLNADDLLVLYTDGVTEAQNEKQALYEEMRLQAVCQAGCAAPAGALLNAIIADVQAFAGAAPQADDITLMIVRRLPA